VKQLDPTDVAGISAQIRAWAETDDRLTPITVQDIVIAEEAIEAFVHLTRSLSRGGKTLVALDETPVRRGGEDLKPLLQSALNQATPITIRRLPHDLATVFHADLTSTEELAIELNDYAALVAIGSGSITDVAKYARHLAVRKASRQIPLICFPTAASVTGYASPVAVLLRDGYTRNYKAAPPDAIVCDLTTLACAPPAMTQAGFAEVLARSVAYGDWFLAAQLGMDNLFSGVPAQLIEYAEQRMIDMADQIAASGLEGIRALIEALLLAGMSMSVLSHTAPMSGWEHLMGYYLDMTAQRDGRPIALHGAQVGVGTLASARAYDKAWSNLDLDRMTADVTAEDMSTARKTIEKVFGPHGPSGHLWQEVFREYEQKMKQWRAVRDTRRRFADRKKAGEYDEPLRQMTHSIATIEEALSRVGAPRRFADLNEPVSPSSSHAAVRYSHLVRPRFTLGDLLTHTAWLTDESATSLLDEPT